ncbi:hypothetical protein [Streptomyces sp. MUSC 14]|uniref:glycine-rich domain-containing protein n=1 Tax=Streptomyces sp. MUSC 14 TaxID=1354889 RepID=UPI0015A5F2A0|nr:hypothetical protein [Streptomyces sp. MUSC 14]
MTFMHSSSVTRRAGQASLAAALVTAAMFATATSASAEQTPYKTPGTYTFTVPTNVTSVTFQLVGSGGGGGGGGAAVTAFTNKGGGGGGGGGGGSLVECTLATTPGETYTLSVPSGGAGGKSDNGFLPSQNGDAGSPATVTSTTNPGTPLIRAAGGDRGLRGTRGIDFESGAGGTGGTGGQANQNICNGVSPAGTNGANGTNGQDGVTKGHAERGKGGTGIWTVPACVAPGRGGNGGYGDYQAPAGWDGENGGDGCIAVTY